MNSLSSLGWKIHDHLKANRPRLFQHLQTNGQLHQFVKQLEQQANDQLDSLESSGLSPQESWTIAMERILPPTEEDAQHRSNRQRRP